jgi:hypothetical protein
MRGVRLLTIISAMAVLPAVAHGQDGFFTSLAGKWAGQGTVRVETGSTPVNVRCSFASSTTARSMDLDGSCTGLVVVSRDVGAVIRSDGKRLSGVYRGSRTGPAALSGTQSGNALNLSIRWASNVNGDRSAALKLEKVGKNGMRLITTDKDPDTGKSVVTSSIDLKRL